MSSEKPVSPPRTRLPPQHPAPAQLTFHAESTRADHGRTGDYHPRWLQPIRFRLYRRHRDS